MLVLLNDQQLFYKGNQVHIILLIFSNQLSKNNEEPNGLTIDLKDVRKLLVRNEVKAIKEKTLVLCYEIAMQIILLNKQFK